MKTNLARVLIAAAFLTAVFFSAKQSHYVIDKQYQNSKPFLTVSDAKAQAFKSSSPQFINNLKGIYTVIGSSSSKNVLLLEDEEAGLMEDVPLYCIFNDESMFYLNDLQPGSELIISGTLSRKGNAVELTDCKLNCINKGTIDTNKYSFLAN